MLYSLENTLRVSVCATIQDGVALVILGRVVETRGPEIHLVSAL